MRTIARHEVVPDGAGSRVTLSIEQTGPMGAVAALVWRSLTQRYIDLEAESLDRRVTREVEARQRAVMSATYDADLPPLEAAARYWEQTVEATLRHGPLFFELAAHAMQGKDHAAVLREELIASWLPSVTELCRAIGIPDEQAPAHARLALGAARGLLLDLLVTGEREQVAEAADLLNRLLLLSARTSVAGVGGPAAD
jgi:hypothetical protein